MKLFSAEGGEKRTSHPTSEKTHQAWSTVLHLQSASSTPSTSLSTHPTASLLAPSMLQAPWSTAPAFPVGSFHQHHTTQGEHLLLQGRGAAPCMPLSPPPQSTEVMLPFSYFAKRRGGRAVHPRHPAPSESGTQALGLSMVPAKACRQQHFKARPVPRRNRATACAPLWSKIWVMLGAAQQRTEKPANSQATGRIQCRARDLPVAGNPMLSCRPQSDLKAQVKPVTYLRFSSFAPLRPLSESPGLSSHHLPRNHRSIKSQWANSCCSNLLFSQGCFSFQHVFAWE